MIPELIKGLFPFFNKEQDKSESMPDLEKYEKVDYIVSDFNVAYSFKQEEIDRCAESWNLYGGINNSQYTKKTKALLEEMGKDPFQGNIIRSKVDGLHGHLIKNPFEQAFQPIDGNHSDLTRFATKLMLRDKGILDWEVSHDRCVLDSLIHLGVEEMVISRRYDPLGNIGFETIEQGHILLDPNWTSYNGWDLKRLYKVAYLTAQQIKDKYNTKEKEIEYFIALKKGQAGQYDNGDETYGMNHRGLNERYGDKYRVIEYHHMKKETRKVRISILEGLTIPDGPEEFIKEWAILNNVNLDAGIIEDKQEIWVYYVTTICPAISRYLILEDRKALIQIGRLPFFPLSSGRVNGKNSGIPELLKSVQRTYNYRETMLNHMIETSAVGGMAVDPDIVGNDDYKKKLMLDNWNKAGFKFFTESGALASGRQYFQELPRTQMDYGVVNEINRMLDMSDRIAKMPAAMDGRSEGSEESGILNARKTARGEIVLTSLYKDIERHWKEKIEAWLYLAKSLYSGVYREIYLGDGEEKIELNKPVITTDGELIENDIAQLPRMKVVITQAPSGETMRSIDRSVNLDFLRVFGEANPISRARATNNLMKTLDIAKKDRETFEQDTELELELARQTVLTNIMQNKATQVQLQMQVGAMTNPQPQQPQQAPQGQGEAPQPPGNPAQTVPGNDQAMVQQDQNSV